jgi:hypothetical protein
MSTTEKGKLLLRERIEAMSKGEVTPSARELRDYELDLPSGGYMIYKFHDLLISNYLP